MKLKKYGVLIVIVIIGIFIFLYNQFSIVTTDFYTVKKGKIYKYIEERGKLQLENNYKIFSDFNGVIKDIKVSEGTSVKTSDELLNFVTDDSSISLKKSEAGYKYALASLENVKNSVKPEKLEEARLEMEQAKVILDSDQKDYNYKKNILDNDKTLLEENMISEQSVKDAENIANLANAELNKAQIDFGIKENNYKLLEKGSSKEEIDAAEANVEKARLEYEEAKLNDSRAKVYASSSGTVLEKYVQVAQLVQKGDSLFQIGDYNTAYISIEIQTDDASDIKIGEKAIITGEIFKNEKINGEVYFIAPKAEEKTSSSGVEQQKVEIRVKCDNTKLLETYNIKPDYGVDVKIMTQEKEGIYVPYKSVIESNGKKRVIAVKNQKTKFIEVGTGIENEDQIEILKGISENDIILKNPSKDMKEGTKVNSK